MAGTVLTIESVRDGSATIDQFTGAIQPTKDMTVNRLMAEGNHWLEGAGWVGPGPMPSDPTYSEIQRLIEKAFVSRNVIDEVVDRLVSAILGAEPRWYWTPDRAMEDDEDPTPEEQTLMDEVNTATTQWWDKKKVHAALKRQIYRMLVAQRCVWRLYLPKSDDAGNVTASDIEEAMDAVFLDIPDPETSGVWTDPETRDEVGIVVIKEQTTNRTTVEVTYLEEDGQTTVRMLPDDQKVTNDLGGALPIVMAEIDSPFITEQLRALNKALNMTLTLLAKGLVDNAFLERLMLNAMPPGHWEYSPTLDENGNKVRDKYVVDRHVTGGRQTTYVQGTDYVDEKGATVVKDPSVVFRDPTDPGGIIKGSDYWYGMMLDEARQSHVIVNQSSTVGFKSREQARGDFIDSTKDPQSQAEASGRALLITLVKVVEGILSKPKRWTGKLKPIFKCKPQYGPLTVPERLQNMNEAKDGYMADETAMSLNGIDDVDAELALIAAQPRAQLKLSTDQAAAVKAWVDAGFTHEVGLHMIGLDDDEIKKITKMNADTTPEPVDPALQDPNNPNPPAPVPGA